LYDARYYRARYKGFTIKAFEERTFWQRNVFRFGPSYEHYNADYATASQLGQDLRPPLPGQDHPRPNADFRRLAGLNALLDLNLRNRPSFAQRGGRLLVRHDSYQALTSDKGLTQGFAEYYGTAKIGIPITLAFKGGATNDGSDEVISCCALPGARAKITSYPSTTAYLASMLRAACTTPAARWAASTPATAAAAAFTSPQRSKRWPSPSPTSSQRRTASSSLAWASASTNRPQI